MTHRSLLSRRAVLRGMLGGAAITVGLPPLDVFMNTSGTAYAGGGSFPKRFGVFYWGNGVLPDKWVPRSEGADWMPSEQLTPLMGVKQHVTVVSGTRVMTANTAPHLSGPAGLLSGDGLSGESFGRASIDQVIAQEIGSTTRFRSIEFGVQRSDSSFSYRGANQVNPPETNPRALFNRLFGEGFRMPGQHVEPNPRLALRRSVLDAVTGQAGRLRDRLGTTDRHRLDEHLEGVRSLEQQIQRMELDPPALAACMRPTMPMEMYPDISGRPQMSQISRVMCDMAVMALACDQTRVFFDMFSQPVNNVLFGTAPAGHHQLTHDEPGEQPTVNTIVTAIIGELAYLINAMSHVTEGDGTLLDHSLVLAISDCSYGRSHSIDNYPMLLCGGASGAVRRGIHYHSPGGENASKVMLSILRAMGVRAAEYGVGPGRVTDPLGAVLT